MQLLHPPTFRLGLVFCALGALASSASGQREGEGAAVPSAISSPIELDRCAEGVCTIEFSGNTDFGYTIYVSGDCVTWEPLGFFVETSPGRFAHVDSTASAQANSYYRIEVHFDRPEQNTLPPRYEDLRLQLGEEAFGEWLRQNKQQFGNCQGISEEELDEMRRNNPPAYEEFESIERVLEGHLNDGESSPGAPPENPETSIPFIPVFNGTYQVMGDEAFAELLASNRQHWGNYQGVCVTTLVEMESLHPDLHQQFIDIELQLEDILEDLVPDPPQRGEEVVLPPQLEQLHQELGDEGFAEWLRDNKRRWSNYQGVSETALDDMQRDHPEMYEQFQQQERDLERWLEQNA